VCEAQAEEAVGLAVEGYLVVLADPSDYLFDVSFGVATYESIIHVHYYVCCFVFGDQVEYRQLSNSDMVYPSTMRALR